MENPITQVIFDITAAIHRGQRSISGKNARTVMLGAVLGDDNIKMVLNSRVTGHELNSSGSEHGAVAVCHEYGIES